MIAKSLFRRIPQRSFSAAADAYQTSSVGNGVQVVSKDGYSNLVNLKFAVLGGSAAEAEDEKGAAHMLSVAAFSGTTNKTGLKLMRELEDIGASISASADREKITLDVTVISSMAEMAFERVADAVVNPPRNKFVLYDSIGAAQLAYDAQATSPKKMLVELLHEAAYGETSPMGASFLAPHGNLENLDPESVLKYRQHQYTADNVVVASSGLTHTAAKSLSDKYLGQLPAGGSKPAASPYIGGDAKLKLDCKGHTYSALAFPASNPKAANVLRLYLNSKVKARGDISAFFAPYSTNGLWGFYASSANGGTGSNALLEVAIAELKNVITSLDETLLTTIKTQLTLQKTLELESDGVTGALIASHLTKTNPQDAADHSMITSADVISAAKASLSAVPTVVTVGKTAGAHSLSAVVNLLK